MKVLITGGSTRVMIDKVRCITNIFNGRTASEIARCAVRKGWDVTLMTSRNRSGRGGEGLYVPYRTYDELYGLMKHWIMNNEYDVIIHSAAVSDYEVDYPCTYDGSFEDVSGGKVPSGIENMYLKLKPTEKIVDKIREWGFKGKLVKFKLQVDMTDDKLLNIAKKSRATSDADFIVANCLEWSSQRAYIIDSNDEIVNVTREYLPTKLLERLGQ
jgi:phosphopantothenate-cysteine ligase/phosphopantothenoylcysteine decarboxylase/phosphopantothenate--cysteine ligase